MAFKDPWGHDGKTYDGGEMRDLAWALTGQRAGVASATSLKVSQQTSPTNTVKVAAGEAVIQATGAGLGGGYQVANDADLTSPTITATGGAVRTDRIIARVTTGVIALEIVAGTAGSATPPTVTGDNFLTLARIELPINTTNITDAMIIDERQVLPLNGTWICTSTTRPASPFEGLEIYETDTDRSYRWTGAAWLEIDGPWTIYTPALVGTGWAIGNGTLSGDFVRRGNSATARFTITFGSTSTYGTGSLSITLPTASEVTRRGMGIGEAFDTSAAISALAMYDTIASGEARVRILDSAAHLVTITNLIPFPWASGDALVGSITYRVA